MQHWEKENVRFDAVYTGYLGSTEQIGYVSDIIARLSRESAYAVIDPAMADNGKLYPAFDEAYVAQMKTLVACADYVLPNITEACFLTDEEYKTEYDRSYIERLVSGLISLGAKNVVLTGVSFEKGKTGVWVQEGNEARYYEHDQILKGRHGTGDIYASAFTGALVRGKSAFESAKIAADYVVECIRFSENIPNHEYGAAFEPVLGKLIRAIETA